MNVKSILDLTKLTRGRIECRQVYRDFIALAAMKISIAIDVVHRQSRIAAQAELLQKYSQAEREQLMTGIGELCLHFADSLSNDHYDDLLGRVYQELGMTGKNGVEFSPYDICSVIAQISMADVMKELPAKGYFTMNDCCCGSGNLLLAAAEEITKKGFNVCQHLVMQANDISLNCVYMTYVQLSLHGIPAVVIHGDTITLKEYDRWYTPAYILGRWVWRCPMPFSSGRNRSDELLKMAEEPMYAAIRQTQWFLAQKQGSEDNDIKKEA